MQESSARAVIITSYLEHSVDIPGLLRPGDYVVCLDGGYDIAKAQNVRPDLLLGDFDSIRSCLPDDPAIEIRQYPPEKDYSDLELAFMILDPSQYRDLLVIGGLGGRLDQTIANIQMLARYTAPADSAGTGSTAEDAPGKSVLRQFRSIEIMDGKDLCFVVRSEGGTCERVLPRPRKENCYLSLFSLSEQCEGLTVRGVRYPLEDAILSRGLSLGVSNEFRAEQAKIQLRRGDLLVVLSDAAR